MSKPLRKKGSPPVAEWRFSAVYAHQTSRIHVPLKTRFWVAQRFSAAIKFFFSCMGFSP
jgi:hypothetical protein